MLAIEVEDVNCESNIFEKWVMPDMLGKRAIIIEEKMVWVSTVDAECTLYKFLIELRLLNNDRQKKTYCTARITPHGATKICSL
jgi:hypothetical protein